MSSVYVFRFVSLALCVVVVCLCFISLSVALHVLVMSLCFVSICSHVPLLMFFVSAVWCGLSFSFPRVKFLHLSHGPAFSVFSFTSPVSSCLIHSCCVPNMFPLTVSFLMCIYCVSFPFSLVYMSPCLKCLGISRCSKFNEFTFPSLGFCDYSV